MKQNIVEEELKNKVAAKWFGKYDCTRIIGKIDFCVGYKAAKGQPHLVEQSLLWAEAKKGEANPYVSLVQLVLTIGRA